MAVNLSFIGGAGWQFLDDSGNPLSGGKIYTYAAGTTTPQTTFTSRSGLVANANPIILDAAGRTPEQIWATEGVLYKYVVANANDVVIRTWDNIGGSIVASDLAQDLANTTNNAKGDALIGFKQSNATGFLTDAVARTVNDKLQEIVSVKDFGAVGDGVAEDAAAFNNAIAALPNGGTIYVPSGQYKISTTVLLNDNITIAGTGTSSVILGRTTRDNSDTPNGLFAAKSKTNIGLRDLKIIPFQGSGGDFRSKFILCSNVQIQNCYWDGFRSSTVLVGTGLWIAGCTTTFISGCSFYNTSDCVYICKSNWSTGTYSETTIIDNCYFDNITGQNYPTCVYVYFGKKTIVKNSFFKNFVPSSAGLGFTGYGVYEGDGSGIDEVTVSNCQFIKTVNVSGAQSVSCLGTQSKLYRVTDCYSVSTDINNNLDGVTGSGLTTLVDSCTFEKCFYPLFLVQTSNVTGYKTATVTNNIVVDSFQGIRLGAGAPIATQFVVSNNSTYDTDRTGILFNVTGPYNAVCNGNIVRNANRKNSEGEPNESGIAFFGGSPRGVLSGNYVYNIEGQGFAKYGFSFSFNNLMTVAEDNVFENMIVANARNPRTTPPTSGFWSRGDRLPYWNVSSGGVQGTVCVFELRTTLTAGASSGVTAITVASGAGTANADVIGVLQSDGSVHWTTIASGGGTTSINLTAGLTNNASNGATVWVYRWKNYGVIS